MDFLSPLFWAGAALLTVPVLLHLVQREKKDRVPFASLMFFPRLPIKQMRRRQLKHLLLLLLRCLGLLLIVLAFTRPVITGAWFARFNPLSSRSVLVLIDNSFSMSRPAVWERAREAARAKIQSLSDGDEGLLVQYGEAAQVVTPWEDSQAPLLEALETRIEKSYAGTAYLEALRLAAEQFDEDRRREREIYWITDLQANGLTSSQGWKVPPEIVVQIEDVGEPTRNLYIQEVRVLGQVYSKQYPHPLLVRVEQSPPGAGEGSVQLWIGDQMRTESRVELDEQGTGRVTLPPFELLEGVPRGRVVLEPSDGMPEDNLFHFVVERQRPRKVLIVSDRNQRSAFFLQKALTTGENLPFEIEVVRSLPAGLDPQTAPLVILDDPRRPPAAGAVRSYLEAGGGVAITAGRQLRPEAWEGWESLLAADFGERRYVRSRSKSFASITEVSWEHPIFAVFQDSHRAALAGAQFYSYWRLEPREGANVVARFDEGDPALLERTVGRGRLLMMAAAADTSWTDFPLRSSFLPVWDRLLEYAAGWQPRPATLRVNQVLAPPASSSEDGGRAGSWDLIDPAGVKVLGLGGGSQEPLVLKLPGVYEVRSDRATDYVAANVQREESDLSRVRAEDLLALFVPGESQASPDEAEVAATRKERQQSLWWVFLVAGGLVLGMEAWVANRSKS